MIKINELLYARMIRMLVDGATSRNIAMETGLHVVTAQSYLRALHKEKATHIIAWVKNTRGVDTTPVFKLGLGEDKPPGSPSCRADRCRAPGRIGRRPSPTARSR